MQLNLTADFRDAMEDLADALDVPPSRYEAARQRYESVGRWLDRKDSAFRDVDVQVYVQGSFLLGTVIRPHTDEEEYDIDMVCQVARQKLDLTQYDLKKLMGEELKAYAEAHSMNEEVSESRRCWTLNYADGAQFHLDALPAIPDPRRFRFGSGPWPDDTGIAITDNEHDNYKVLCSNWRRSDPKGYAKWFKERMKPVLEKRRLAMAIESRADVEDVPEYEVRTPLQLAIQILKRHRDQMFAKRGMNGDDKPISIILSTLAGHAYRQEPTVDRALTSILANMHQYIEDRGGTKWIVNPVDPSENFADRWIDYPEREETFFMWLAMAREDFGQASQAGGRDKVLGSLEEAFGQRLVATAEAKRVGSRQETASGFIPALRQRAKRILNPQHRQQPPWDPRTQGTVEISRVRVTRNGFREYELHNDGIAQPKGAGLRFEAKTNVPTPYRVYWQVVNTGPEAERERNGLRGGFEEGAVERGTLTRKEDTRYRGAHSIECFIVKDGLLAARSGQFIVNIM